MYNEHTQYWWCIWEYCVTFWLVTSGDGVWNIRSKELWYRWLSGFENNWFFGGIIFKWLLAKSITSELKSYSITHTGKFEFRSHFDLLPCIRWLINSQLEFAKTALAERYFMWLLQVNSSSSLIINAARP